MKKNETFAILAKAYPFDNMKEMTYFSLDYADSADVSEYAYEAMCWNTMNGIITGMGDNTLSPKTNTTRAQVAAVIIRLSKILTKNYL